MMRKILAPHKEQDGWVYVRVRPREVRKMLWYIWDRANHYRCSVGYPDEAAHRIISSRRVEEAVETADYLKRCVGEGLYVTLWPHGRFSVHGDSQYSTHWGDTLREAYHRYMAASCS